ncbi:hypothetical protein C0Q70_07463 [Pomacea canaliculata]|uniref:glucuronosyl-galactosyl-proteoglycan 4-alpha-N-acetylglucosaminyltransferase n=1 Tax=Pomacea canaliculata TaxID=400727 RepID=A0A2T7PF56_POMCA|nr:hypothetical protein C0Q70_07463 [Pomacea canaliculata]
MFQVKDDAGDDSKKGLDIKLHIEELHKIKISVSNELRDLESKRQSLQTEIAGYSNHIETLRSQYGILKKEIAQVKLTLDQLKFEQEETKAYVPSIKAPQRIIMENHPSQNISPPSSPFYCKMETCFDFSRCSLVSGFPVFFYDPQEISLDYPPLDEFVLSSVVNSFGRNVYATDDPSGACVFLVLMGEIKGALSPDKLEHFLYSLPHWNGDGRNHILFNIARNTHVSDLFINVNTGRAVLVQSSFATSTFREGFDIIIPPSLGLAGGDVWSEIPPLSPIRRKHLLSYWGEYIPTHQQVRMKNFLHNVNFELNEDEAKQFRKLQAAVEGEGEDRVDESQKLLDTDSEADDSTLGNAIISWLKELQLGMGDNALVELSCGGAKVAGMETEWGLCGEAAHRSEMLSQSTFTLLLLPTNESLISTTIFQTRFYEALKYGSIPVILGLERWLPFDEVLNWEIATFTLPLPRITEIPFFLRTFSDADISSYRSHGRNFWETYFGSTQRILDTVLAVLRARLQIPAAPVREEPSFSVFNESFVPLKMEGPDPEPETDEVLGPIEPRFPSEKFRRTIHVAGFFSSGYGFRPVSQGTGGAGKEFSESLGGNYPREQFTIVMLTYERELVLVQALQRLKGLPFLNKVLVVWNNPSPPSADLRWPDIGVPLEVVKTRRNSLNNRFLPYNSIETEAVLSIDDDAHLRHDEIVFGFRVWREERDRIVGFPGRFHAWDPKYHTWHYNSNYSCELSMVLTGAAFFHKYYAYLYSYVMPQAIRDKVDQYTNCEDIAMNFLVAHITRKPPLKVTSRWTFRCPGCPNTLSSNDTHFEERHHCMNFFLPTTSFAGVGFGGGGGGGREKI